MGQKQRHQKKAHLRELTARRRSKTAQPGRSSSAECAGEAVPEADGCAATVERRLERQDICGGEHLNATEYQLLRSDYLEQRKVCAMEHVVRLKREGICKPAVSKQISADGAGVDEILRQQRLPHPTGPARQELEDCFIPERPPGVKEATCIWILSQLKARRAKGSTATPLTIASFRGSCNSVLLKPRIDGDPKLKHISEVTAGRWLHTLGFEYKSHKNDGHERADVVCYYFDCLKTLLAVQQPHF
ncbi:MAG: hypothetical protein SGPRY_004537 [Prymnesium sp.]